MESDGNVGDVIGETMWQSGLEGLHGGRFILAKPTLTTEPSIKHYLYLQIARLITAWINLIYFKFSDKFPQGTLKVIQ